MIRFILRILYGILFSEESAILTLLITLGGAFVGALLGGVASFIISRYFHGLALKRQAGLPKQITRSMLTELEPILNTMNSERRAQVESAVEKSSEEIANTIIPRSRHYVFGAGDSMSMWIGGRGPYHPGESIPMGNEPPTEGPESKKSL